MVRMPFRGGQKLQIRVDEGVSKEKCVEFPGGHPVTLVNGKEACLFVHDEEGKPVTGIEDVKNISEKRFRLRTQEGESAEVEI